MITKYAQQPTAATQLNRVPPAPAKPEVVFSAWWRGDPAAGMARLPGLAAEPASDYVLVAQMAQLDLGEVLARVGGGHRPYVARLGGVPVAYGWATIRRASIGELGLDFAIPAGNAYLWDFATLPAWRGLGIYPRLLQTIVAREAAQADRFWIGHVRENSASGHGILKAGFRVAGATVCLDGRAMTFVASGPTARAAACAALLGLGLSDVPSVRSA
jgi:GNAT superfamily N-acetyltransferase